MYPLLAAVEHQLANHYGSSSRPLKTYSNNKNCLELDVALNTLTPVRQHQTDKKNRQGGGGQKKTDLKQGEKEEGLRKGWRSKRRNWAR